MRKKNGGEAGTDILIGMSDGLIVPFAVATGLNSAGSSPVSIITAVSIVIAGAALLMAMGSYFAAKPAAKNEYTGHEKMNEAEKEQAKTFFANIGLTQEMQQKAIEEIDKDHKQWDVLITQYGLGPDPQRSVTSALTVGLSYIAGGFVPLMPYFFIPELSKALVVSAAVTLAVLFVFGFIKNKTAGVNPWAGAIRAVLTGALAAGGAFGVGKLFEQ